MLGRSRQCDARAVIRARELQLISDKTDEWSKIKHTRGWKTAVVASPATGKGGDRAGNAILVPKYIGMDYLGGGLLDSSWDAAP